MKYKSLYCLLLAYALTWKGLLPTIMIFRKKNVAALTTSIIKLTGTVMVQMKFSLSSPDHTPVEPVETPPYGDASIKENPGFTSPSL